MDQITLHRPAERPAIQYRTHGEIDAIAGSAARSVLEDQEAQRCMARVVRARRLRNMVADLRPCRIRCLLVHPHAHALRLIGCLAGCAARIAARQPEISERQRHLRGVNAGRSQRLACRDGRGVFIEREDDGARIAGDEAVHVDLAVVDEAEVVLEDGVGGVGQSRHGEGRRQRDLILAARFGGGGDVRRHHHIAARPDDIQPRAVAVKDRPVADEAGAEGCHELWCHGAVFRIVEIVVLHAVNHHAVRPGAAAAGVDEEIPEKHRMPVPAAVGAHVIECGQRAVLGAAARLQRGFLNGEIRVRRAVPREARQPRAGLCAAVEPEAVRAIAGIGAAALPPALHDAAEAAHSDDIRHNHRAGLRRAVGVPAKVSEIPVVVRIAESEIGWETPHRSRRRGHVVHPQVPIRSGTRPRLLAADDDPPVEVIDRSRPPDRLRAVGDRMAQKRARGFGARDVGKSARRHLRGCGCDKREQAGRPQAGGDGDFFSHGHSAMRIAHRAAMPRSLSAPGSNAGLHRYSRVTRR